MRYQVRLLLGTWRAKVSTPRGIGPIASSRHFAGANPAAANERGTSGRWRSGTKTGDNSDSSQKPEGIGDTTASPPYKPMTEPETLLQHAAFLRGLAQGLLGDADRAGDVVQQTWLAALEKLVAEKQLASTSELGERKRQWDQAARNTPHGEPIVLDDS